MARLEALVSVLQAQNAELRTMVAAQGVRIAELERQLGLNSSNSGKTSIQRWSDKEVGAGQQPA